MLTPSSVKRSGIGAGLLSLSLNLPHVAAAAHAVNLAGCAIFQPLIHAAVK
jgi:hypothetical protein